MKFMPRSVSLLRRFLRPMAFLLAAIASAGQHPHSPRPDLAFEHISVSQGLSNFTVTAMAQDKQGFLWLGTEDGLNKYDGYTFQQYLHNPYDSTTLPAPQVSCLLVDHTGTLWVGTPGGEIMIGDPARGDLHRRAINTPGREGPPQSVGKFYEDRKGVVWVATYDGVFRFDRPSDTFHPVEGMSHVIATSFAEDSDEHVWIGLSSGGLLRWDRGTHVVTRYTSTPGRTTTLPSNSVFRLAVDRQGVLWAATGAGLCRYDGTTDSFHRYIADPAVPNSLAADIILDLLADSRGNIWVGTFHLGLQLYDPVSDTFFRYEHEPDNPRSLDESRIQCLFEDRQGNVWVSTYRSGLNRYDPASARFHTLRASGGTGGNVLAAPVYAIWEDLQKDVWIGTFGGGLNRYNPETGTFRVYTAGTGTGLRSDAILSLFESRDGRIWVGGAEALYWYDRQHDRFHPVSCNRASGVPGSEVKSLLEDPSGDLWVGFNAQGIFRVHPPTMNAREYFTDARPGKPASIGAVWTLHADHAGTLWAGSFGDGIYRLDRAKDLFSKIILPPGTPRTLTMGAIYCITEGPDSMLWVGTFTEGLNRFDRRTYATTTYRKLNGLPNNFVKGIIPDGKGHLWLSTDYGLSRCDLRTMTFRNYAVEDGLRGNVFLSGAYHRGRSGLFYFGGNGGVTFFHPDSIRENTAVPPVVITAVRVFDSPLETPTSAAPPMTLSYDRNFLSFEFVGIDFACAQELRYAYRLDGVDRDWIQAGTKRYARYTQLPPGEFIFRVRVANNDGVWGETTSLPFTITPPYWDQWWFRTLVVVAAITLLALLYRYRVNKLLDIERLRVRIASDLHDDIGSSLTKISLQSELIQEGVEPREMNRYLGNIAAMSRELVTTMSDIVWSIDARNDTWGSLLDKIRDTALGVLGVRGIELQFAHSGLDARRRIPVDVRENLYLICKEAVNNIARHAAARNVSMVIRNDYDKFSIVIADDGQGWPANDRHVGHGLRNMQMRAERLGGHVEFPAGAGGRVVLTTPHL